MPLLRVHFSIVQISPRLDRASFKDPSCNFAEWGAKAHGIKTRHRVSRKHLLLPLFLPARGRLTRISASPGGVEHLDIPVWSLHNARCALEFCRAASPRVKSAAVVFASCFRSSLRRDATQKSSTSFLSRFLSGPRYFRAISVTWRGMPGWLLTGRDAPSRSRIHADYAS